MVEIAKSPISENKFELVSAAAAAFKTLWQQCQTLSSIENSSLDSRVIRIKQLLNREQDLVLHTVQALPETLRSAVANRMPRDFVQYFLGEDGDEADSQS